MKNTRKNSKKKHMKDIKIFLYTKKKKKRLNKNLPEKQKRKLAQYRRNHYLTHEK